jgi:hydrogenase expression/formation protein HypE
MKGKLTFSELSENVLNNIDRRHSEVILGAKNADDAAAVDINFKLLACADPITSASKNIGALALNVCANDIAACGGNPLYALLTILMPVSASVFDINKIMLDAKQCANELNLEIIGGHTEFTSAVTRPVICAAVLGKAGKRVFKTSDARPGDAVIVTKSLGLEGSAVIAHDFEKELKECLGEKELTAAKEFINSVSVLKDSRCVEACAVNAMHDITEGGLIGGINEVCKASGYGAEIDLDCVPLSEVTKKLCSHFKLNPYKLLSSGSLIITTPKPDEVISELKKNNIAAAKIGKITESKEINFYINNERQEFAFDGDEINKLY